MLAATVVASVARVWLRLGQRLRLRLRLASAVVLAAALVVASVPQISAVVQMRGRGGRGGGRHNQPRCLKKRVRRVRRARIRHCRRQ